MADSEGYRGGNKSQSTIKSILMRKKKKEKEKKKKKREKKKKRRIKKKKKKKGTEWHRRKSNVKVFATEEWPLSRSNTDQIIISTRLTIFHGSPKGKREVKRAANVQ